VAVTDSAQRRPTTTAATHPDGADAEQGLVIQDVLAPEQRELAAGEDLAPGTTERHIHLPHVNLRAGLRAVPEVVVHGACPWGDVSILDLWREPEVDPQVHSSFFAARLERGERRQEAGAN